MKRKYLLIFMPLILLGMSFSIFQDDEGLKKLISQLDRFAADYPQEKIHLHMDKPYYAIGDNIWFKAYVVNAEKNQLSNLSKIIYVELINDKDSVKQSLRLPLSYGLAAGDFTLPDTLREGNYRIRAYTTWMRNFGEEYFFDKTFSVGNSISNSILTTIKYTYEKTGNANRVNAEITYTDLAGAPLANRDVSYQVNLEFRDIHKGSGKTDENGKLKLTFTNSQPFILKSGRLLTNIRIDDKTVSAKNFPIKSTSDESSISFFPEGGEMVAGIKTRLAFKVTGADGLGKDATGVIKDKSGTVIADFRTEFAGMGYFRFTPLPGESYTAQVRFADGSEKTSNLPRILPRGYVLNVGVDDPENLQVSIITSETLQNNERFTLVAQSNGQIHFVARNNLGATAFNTNIPKNKFPTGILQITLFSPSNQPVAERLVFIQRDDQLKIAMEPSKLSYKAREKVLMSVDVKDDKGQPAVGAFSVAVIDETKVPFDEDEETTILSNLLLSSDLRGFIEKPNHYFTENSAERIRQLDGLMMTQGWRRFEWKNILAGNYPNLNFQPETNLMISGRVKSAGGAPVVGGTVTLFSSAGDVFLLDTLTNQRGEFRFENLVFNDSTKFLIQARTDKGRKNVEIELDRIPPQLVTKNKNEALLELNVNQSMVRYLENSRSQYDDLRRYGLVNKSILLDEVKVVETRPILKNSSNLNGAGRADAIVKAEDLQNCVYLSQCLQGRIAGVIFQNGIAYSTRSMNTSFRGPVPMQIIMDGMPVEPDFLSMINPNDVESIEVLRSGANTAIYGLRGGGGVLVINTKRGELNRDYRSYAPGVLTYAPRGFYKARTFYAPEYDDPKTNTKVADLRTTVYWNPGVVTDSTGKASFDFFSADTRGTYKAVIEGIAVNGRLARAVRRFTIE